MKEILCLTLSIKQMKEIDDFKAILGTDNSGIADMERLLSLAEMYGYRDWLVFDATIVRGLSYYTGVVFEAFDRKVKRRVRCVVVSVYPFIVCC
jgi:histidyl-tRNA synthetase